MIQLEFRNVDFFAEGRKPENPEKNPRNKGDNQEQTRLNTNHAIITNKDRTEEHFKSQRFPWNRKINI
jgi:hypothetical protein